jgi:hypothetical protein
MAEARELSEHERDAEMQAYARQEFEKQLTTKTSSSRFVREPVGTRRDCSPPTSSGCTAATRSRGGGRSTCSPRT